MENRLNLPPFYIGQKVVCLKSGNYHKKGEIVTIMQIDKTKCGCYMVGTNVSGIEYLSPFTAKCDTCGTVTTEGIYGFYATDFKPLEEMNAPLLTFQQIKEVEKEEVLILN